MLAGCAGEDWDGGHVQLAADSARFRLEAEPVHLRNRRAARLDECGDRVAPGLHARRHPHELHFGAAHVRGRDDLEHAAGRSALRERGEHYQFDKKYMRRLSRHPHPALSQRERVAISRPAAFECGTGTG